MADAPSIPTLEEFLAFTRTRAFARVNRYAVGFQAPPGMSIDPREVYDVSMLCDEASIPGKQIMPRSLRINALSEPRAHTMDFWNDTASFQFLIDNDWTARKFFEDWMTLCVGTGVTREVGDYDQYATNVMIYSLAPVALGDGDEGFVSPEQVLWSVRLVEAWPRSIVIAPISYANTTIHRMVVTFMYKRWESLDAFEKNREDSAIFAALPSTIIDTIPGGSLGVDTATQLKKDNLLNSLSKGKNAIDRALKDFDTTMQNINKAVSAGKNKVDPYISTVKRVQDRFSIVKKKIAPFTGK
jgi:hypothetical protein